ncbi:hypothetical protein F7734_21645 [Scytonema sp. UIC 10036]|uniref:hypothetical protein n=1 Tax=Scytonema sp. UIC 10036 TaxID=2304196 RepID=UPI0012DA39DE|nr:hypothetical protein [Scytonema sp. UIC 10036]MUG94824.1 hypothetical protein [Scytonema sp. UIC 10036]
MSEQHRTGRAYQYIAVTHLAICKKTSTNQSRRSLQENNNLLKLKYCGDGGIQTHLAPAQTALSGCSKYC